jgi:archaemetzincin
MKPIELQPLGDAEPDVLESLIPALREVFGVDVRVRGKALPLHKHYDEQRGQYNSTSLLHELENMNAAHPDPAHDVQIVGVTRQDLFIPILTYIFGEAALGGSIAVVSYHRFREELYGLSPNPNLLKERLTKVIVHEIGHSLGLVHCTLQECVMHAASYVEELDLKTHNFCPYCQNLLPAIPPVHE